MRQFIYHILNLLMYEHCHFLVSVYTCGVKQMMVLGTLATFRLQSQSEALMLHDPCTVQKLSKGAKDCGEVQQAAVQRHIRSNTLVCSS